MALTRAKKAQKVEILSSELAGSTSAIVGTFSKLTVSQDFALRQKVREAGGRYRVLKNKLASRAAEGTGIEAALQGLKGVSSVAYTSGDPVALAKALSDWIKENAEFTFKLGIVDGKVINVEEVKALATMPSKEEIFAKLLFLINAPAQRLATVMAATGRDLAVVVNQAVEQNKFSQAAAVGAAEPESRTAPAADEMDARKGESTHPDATQADSTAADSTATDSTATDSTATDSTATDSTGTDTTTTDTTATDTTATDTTGSGTTGAGTAEAVSAETASEEKQAEAAATEAPAEG